MAAVPCGGVSSPHTDMNPAWLQLIDTERVAISAGIDPAGRLHAIEGFWPKFQSALEEQARAGLLHLVVVAEGQNDVDARLLRLDADPLRVIKAVSLEDAIERLYETF